MNKLEEKNKIKKEIVSLIRDDNLRIYLFDTDTPYGEEEITEEIYFGYQIVEKIIYLLFMLYYSLYIDQKKGMHNNYIKNKRVLRNFDKLFISQEISLDFMLFILSELQIVRDNSELLIDKMLFNDWKQELQLYQKTSKSNVKSELELLRKILKIVQSAPILTKLELVYDENNENKVFDCEVKTVNFKITLDSNEKDGLVEKKILSNNMFLIDTDKNLNYYAVYRIEYMGDSYSARYKDLNEKKKYSEFIKLNYNKESSLRVFSIERGFQNSTVEDEEAILMNKLYGKGFNKIRILALAIADLINDKGNRLALQIKQKYLVNTELSHLVNDIYDNDKTNWDNAITILLIEIGPSELLANILDNNEFIFRNLMDNISKRMNDKVIIDDMINGYNSIRINTDNSLLKDKFTSSVHRDNYYLEYERKLMAKTIIQYLNNLSKGNTELKYPGLVESLPNRIKHYREIVTSQKSITEKVIEINCLFEEVFKFINVYYIGLIGYAKEYSKLDSDKLELQEIKERCEEVFINEAKDEFEKISGKSIGELIGRFKEILKMAYDKTETTVESNLEKIIGRFEICPYNEFIDLVDDKKGEQFGFTTMINNKKHSEDRSKSKSSLPTNSDYERFYERGYEILMLLFRNKDFNKNGSYFSTNISLMPIFPYTIKFNMNRKMKDGYEIKSYSMESIDNVIQDIKILSSVEHTEHENYYCIPNFMSSTKKYWIEPFFIRSEIVDSILAKKGRYNATYND